MLGDLALVEEDALTRVDACREIGGGYRADLVGKSGGVLPHGDGVHIHHAEDALVRFLHLDPLHHGPQVVAQVQVAGRLHAGEDAR